MAFTGSRIEEWRAQQSLDCRASALFTPGGDQEWVVEAEI